MVFINKGYKGPRLKRLDLAFRVSAVHQLFIFRFVFQYTSGSFV